MGNLTMIWDPGHGTYITMDLEKFFDILACANNRRKARHAGRFTMEEFARMFGLRSNHFDTWQEIDRDYPISFEKTTYDLIPNKITNRNVDFYTLTYQTKPYLES